MPLVQNQLERFTKYQAPTLDELLEIMNASVSPYARILQLGVLADGSWVAVTDVALQLVLLTDDIQRIEESLVEAELDENAVSSDDELNKNKTALTA